MNYLILIFGLLAIIIFSYIIFNRDVLSLSFLMSISFLIGVILAVIGINRWHTVYSLEDKVVYIILLGNFSLFLFEAIIRLCILPKDFYKQENYKIIRIHSIKLLIILIYVIITTLLFFLEIRRIAIGVGYTGNNIGKMIYTYRRTTSLYTTKYLNTNLVINSIVSQLKKGQDIIAFIFIYILINNIVADRKNIFKSNNIKYTFTYILIIIICAISSVLGGGRIKLFTYIVGAIFMYICLMRRSTKKQINAMKLFKKGIVYGIPILIIFYFMSSWLGREQKTNIIDYISFYYGSSITSLNNYVLNPPEKSEHFGYETFSGMYTILYKMGLVKETNSITLKWIPYKIGDKYMNSNIFTAFRRYYQDFGYLGIFVCQAIFCIILYFLYYKSARSSNKIYMIFYSMYFYSIIDHVRVEVFFRNFFSVATIVNIILLIIFYLFLFKVTFGKRKSIT